MANMARPLLAVFLMTCIIWSTSEALQVAPNSGCASICIDEANQDKSDPNVSNTKGSDIVCRDENYSTPVGQKFKQCVSCLQNSTAVAPSESDLQWFLFNLRFAFNSCLFGLANATDPISSPCSIQTSCGPLVGALQDGMDKPQPSNRYSYCTAFGGSFLGNRLAPCTKCLTLTSEQKYLGNFLVALHAGCEQLPEAGTLLGLDGNLFSKRPVNITSPIVAPTPPPMKTGLTTGALVGIGVAGLVVLFILVTSIFVGLRKRTARKNRELLSSSLDNRFGSKGVTVPVPGAYNDPYPPKPTAYQSAGLVQIPSKLQMSFVPRKNQPQPEKEYYFNHHHPISSSQNIEMTRVGGAATNYNPRHVESPAPEYSPQGSTERGDTPMSHTPSPTSTAHSRTHLHEPSSSPETSNPTRTHVSPMAGAGLPKPALPARSNSNATATSSYSVRPGRHTRDLSVGRGTDDRMTSDIQISGPMITVSTRYDEEEEARRRKERERLYRQGYKTKDEEEKGSPDSDEMWPGNY